MTELTGLVRPALSMLHVSRSQVNSHAESGAQTAPPPIGWAQCLPALCWDSIQHRDTALVYGRMLHVTCFTMQEQWRSVFLLCKTASARLFQLPLEMVALNKLPASPKKICNTCSADIVDAFGSLCWLMKKCGCHFASAMVHM